MLIFICYLLLLFIIYIWKKVLCFKCFLKAYSLVSIGVFEKI